MKRLILLVVTVSFCSGLIRAQIPNSGLENWTNTSGYEDPDGWSTFNFFSAIVGAPATVNKTSDAHSGNFGGTVESISYTDMMGTTHELPGLLFTGFPNTTRFADFSFWYKFTNAGGDTALVGAILTKWNAATQETDSVGLAFIPITSNVSSYTQVNLPVQYFNSLIPDTAYIFVFSNVTENFIAGSTIWVDNFSLSGISNINELNSIQAKIYPNPATTSFVVELEDQLNGHIEIYDLTGRKVLAYPIETTTTHVPVTTLTRSQYLYFIRDNKGRIVRTGQVQLGQ